MSDHYCCKICGQEYRLCKCGETISRRMATPPDPKPDRYDEIAQSLRTFVGSESIEAVALALRAAAKEAQLRVLDELDDMCSANGLYSEFLVLRATIKKEGPLMTETQRPMHGGPYCSCQRVLYDAIRNHDGTASESWTCADCGSRFNRQHWLDKLAAEKKALEERVAELRQVVAVYVPLAIKEPVLTADDAKAAGEPETKPYRGPDGDELPWNLVREVVPKPDDRASRRRAYVRKHAARFLRAYIRAGCSADLSRANAIEQAGLIFDETEPGE